MYLSHARLASWRMTIRSPWPNVAYGTHKRSSRNRKSGSLAFTLPEPRRSTRWKCCQPLSPTCDCSRNIATPCYRLRGVGNRRSAGIVHGPRIRAMNGSSVGVNSSFGENAAICLQRRRRPDCKSHLALTLIAAVDFGQLRRSLAAASQSLRCSFRRRTDRRGFLCNPALTIARTCLGVLFRYRISQVSRGRSCSGLGGEDDE